MASQPRPGGAMLLYQPYGAIRELFYDKSPEIVLSGPAGTGKSRGCLEKLHLICERYPGARCLILRKTREALTQSALVTFEEKVVPPGHPILEGPKRNLRQSYRYPNGSEIVVCGLDKPQKVMSTEFDIAYFQELIECAEQDWEMVSTRLRNNVVPYQQMFADTNPDAPFHWINLRAANGRLKMYETRHEDNPTIWNHKVDQYTTTGAIYMSKLDALTGVRYQRLRLGKWVAAEGVVYEGWSREVHAIDRFKVPIEWTRIWTVDFGFTNPFVWQNWAVSPDDQLILTREIYHTHLLVEEVAPLIVELTEYEPRPRVILCDHDAEDRATLQKHLKLGTKAAWKGVADGIQAVSSRLKLRGNKKPGLVIFRDALYERDLQLVDALRPTCTIDEMDGYVWDTTGGQKKGDVPLKQNDHGCDAMRYTVAFHDKISGGGTSLIAVTTKRDPSDMSEMIGEGIASPPYGWINARRRQLRASGRR